MLLFVTSQIFAASCGDVNADNEIDIVDALLIAQHYVGITTVPEDIADVNNDQEVDIIDALFVAQYYVGIINALPGCPEDDTPKKCMFIGATPGRENSEYDAYIIPQLEAWGYIIDKKHNSTDIDEYTEADFAPYDFIFLSETMHSSLMSPLRDIKLPMLCSDGFGGKESALGFAPDSDTNLYDPARPIVFLDGGAGHPLAAGYTPGTVVDLGTNACISMWGKPSIDIIPIAGTEGNTSQLVIYGIEKGTQNMYGDTINHRVAVVGIHAFCYNVLSQAGVDTFKAGIEWILKE